MDSPPLNAASQLMDKPLAAALEQPRWSGQKEQGPFRMTGGLSKREQLASQTWGPYLPPIGNEKLLVV